MQDPVSTGARRHGRWTTANGVALGLLIAVVAIVYLPYVRHAGFTYDDWLICDMADLEPGLLPTWRAWFPLYGFRPLAAMLMSAQANLFHWWGPGYALTTLVFWFSTGAIVAGLYARYFGRGFTIVFLLLFSFPSISSMVLFSAGQMSICTGAMAMWAASFWLVDRSLRTASPIVYLVAANLVIALALLIYEAFMPLLVLSMLWPAAVASDDVRSLWRRIDRSYVVRYIAPALGVLVLGAIYQKLILPQFMPTESRLSSNPSNAVASVASWGVAVFAEYPALLIEAVPFAGVAFRGYVLPLALPALFVGLGVLSRPSQFAAQDEHTATVRRNLLVITALAFLAGSLIFFLSGRPAMVWGGSNRAMTPTWIALAMLLAIVPYVLRPAAWYGAAVALVVALNLLSFLIQRNSYLTAWTIQDEVLSELADAAREADVPRGSLVLGCVPNHLPNSYNLAMVLVGKNDFGIGARRYTEGRFAGGSVFYANGLERVRERAAAAGNPDDLVALVKLYEIDLDPSQGPLWYFEFDPKTKATRLMRVRHASHLREIVDDIVEQGINTNREPIMKHYYDHLRDVIKPLVRGSATAPPS